MNAQEAIELVKDGKNSLYFDNDNIGTLNIVLLGAFKNKATRDDYGPDKWFRGNQIHGIWIASPNNRYDVPFIRVSEIVTTVSEVMRGATIQTAIEIEALKQYPVDTFNDSNRWKREAFIKGCYFIVNL
jgi:hypothetical protein